MKFMPLDFSTQQQECSRIRRNLLTDSPLHLELRKMTSAAFYSPICFFNGGGLSNYRLVELEFICEEYDRDEL